MTVARRSYWIGALAYCTLAACVTINVYFPAAAAQQAADRIIQEVYGELPPADQQTLPPATTPPQSRADNPVITVLAALLSTLVAPAHAQDINASSPAINAIKSAMTARHKQLLPLYGSGAIGLTADGGVAVRDLKAAPLAQRNKLKQLVKQENADRRALYREIAKANGQPRWEADIRATFARQWIANAQSGWWYQAAGGGWQRK